MGVTETPDDPLGMASVLARRTRTQIGVLECSWYPH